MHPLKHFMTISYHKYLVMKGCFAVGLYKNGLLHDLSKYTPVEFFVGAKYYQGTRSPNNAEREEKGYSASWLHHKGRNKHHFEYWIDYCADAGTNVEDPIKPAPMPDKYIIEMLMDRIAAARVYNGDKYTDKDPLIYFERGSTKLKNLMHPYTYVRIHGLLKMLAAKGESYTFAYIKGLKKKGYHIKC